MNGDQALTEFPRTQIPEDAFVFTETCKQNQPHHPTLSAYLHEQKMNHNNAEMWLSTTGSGDRVLPVTKNSN